MKLTPTISRQGLGLQVICTKARQLIEVSQFLDVLSDLGVSLFAILL